MDRCRSPVPVALEFVGFDVLGMPNAQRDDIAAYGDGASIELCRDFRQRVTQHGGPPVPWTRQCHLNQRLHGRDRTST